MQKKLISAAIASASAVAMAMSVQADPKPNAQIGLDNPLDEPAPDCGQTQDGFTAHWWDPDDDEGMTKYGGDIEFDALVWYTCEAGGEFTEGGELTTVDIGLSRDESDPFSYVCEAEPTEANEEQVACWASIAWEDIASTVEDAAADKFGSMAEECTYQEHVCTEWEGEPYVSECIEEHVETFAGEFQTHGATLEDVAFGVKEMNPPVGQGSKKKQNYEKAFAYCSFTPAE